MNILVVEDHGPTQRALCRAVEYFGHHAHGAGSGTEALVVARTALPEACLLDMNLPDMTGLDVLSELMCMEELLPFRAIAVTGDSEPPDIERYYDAGIDEVLIKPVSLQMIGKALKEKPETD